MSNRILIPAHRCRTTHKLKLIIRDTPEIELGVQYVLGGTFAFTYYVLFKFYLAKFSVEFANGVFCLRYCTNNDKYVPSADAADIHRANVDVVLIYTKIFNFLWNPQFGIDTLVSFQGSQSNIDKENK